MHTCVMIYLNMNHIVEELEKIGIVPVVKIDDAEKAVPVARALAAGGIPCAEITFRTSCAAESIKRIKREVPKILLGAGTVLTIDQVDQAVSAGAEFIVTPGFNPKVVDHCLSKGITIIPGCSNPSDIEMALERGLCVVKFFPAEQSGGIEYVKAVSAPYPQIRFMPTGGINAGNIGAYSAFKKVLACGGSWMVSPDIIKRGDYDAITALSKEAVQKIFAARFPHEENNILHGEEKKSLHVIEDAVCNNTVKRVITFGEIMLRLAPEGYTRFVQAEKYEATFGGSEANTAVSLANFGIDVSFVTRLPQHEIGQAAVNSLRRFGVDTSHIARGGGRVGMYFLEKGAAQRPSKVIYDRVYSSIAESSSSDFDWNSIFEGTQWFHFSGITPALGKNTAAACMEACKAAKQKGLTVSCDLNYRKNLWSKEEAGKVMSALMPYIDVCIANEEDAANVFGIHAGGTNVDTGKINHDGYKDAAKKLKDRFGFKKIAFTLRESISANDNNWSAMLYDGNDFYFSRKYAVHIVDRVGAGDSFAAGLIYADLKHLPPQESINFAAAASCLKHSIEGDFNHASVDEVKKLAEGNESGRVLR